MAVKQIVYTTVNYHSDIVFPEQRQNFRSDKIDVEIKQVIK